MKNNERLPIDDILANVAAKLRATPNLVLVAPPGSGKTTRVPGALVDRRVLEPSCGVLILEPRRLAARLAAERVADERSTRIGDEVGYQIRFENRTTARTRITFVTEGILARRLFSDPSLEGVGAVVLDEFHERSIHADFSLALLKEVQETIRPDLRIIVMSATLDVEPIERFLGSCSVARGEGRLYPVDVRWLDRPDARPLAPLVSAAVRKALTENEAGDVLTFLPGAAEIREVAGALAGVRDVDVLPLYGDLSARDQDRAVRPSERRKVVLATNIAESSLTIPNVRIVVDSGWAKILRFDPSIGLDHLETVRIGTKSIEQRTGRAGRVGPGVAYRLWTQKESWALRGEDRAEIQRIDLAPTLLDCLRWSQRDPMAFGWFEAPPAVNVARGLGLLRSLGALDGEGFALTPKGRFLAELPLHPRLAVLLSEAARRGRLERGALFAAIASEREVLGKARPSDGVTSSDLLLRAEALEAFERSARTPYDAERLGLVFGAATQILRVRTQLLRVAKQLGPDERASVGTSADAGRATRMDPEEADLRAIAAAYLDRMGRRVGTSDKVRLSEGREVRLCRTSSVKDSEFLVALNVDAGGRSGAREGGASDGVIRWASQVDPRWFPTTARTMARWNRTREVAEWVEETRLADLVIDVRPARGPGDALRLSAELEIAARGAIDRAIPMTDSLEGLLGRYAFVRAHCPELEWPPMDAACRLDFLESLCAGRRSFEELRVVSVVDELLARLGPEKRQRIEAYAPTALRIPSGRFAPLTYGAVDGSEPPILSVRLQEIFGLYETPRVAGGRVPIKVELLSPSSRPVQVTQDLANFWRTTYQEVRKELRRRYPKHQWPEDPRDGVATTRVRPRRD
ncbi:MAG: ATP-dependent helicase HrpB [Deltaproteobacteria bacterium]|nr:ATP-dependent helicase HrpB [Deltaproteobacteria bacterium]